MWEVFKKYLITGVKYSNPKLSRNFHQISRFITVVRIVTISLSKNLWEFKHNIRGLKRNVPSSTEIYRVES